MRTLVRPALGAVGLLLVAGGCAQKKPVTDDTPPLTGEVSIVVQNHHWNDVILYIVHDGVSDRVATVTATSTRSFVLPLRLFGPSGTFRLAAYQLGGDQRHVSEMLIVQRNEHITYTLESDLDRSSVMIQ
jgi:hypothetical protein